MEQFKKNTVTDAMKLL